MTKTLLNPYIPLAGYGEIAAPLRSGQLTGLDILGVDRLTQPDRLKLNSILNFYIDRYKLFAQ